MEHHLLHLEMEGEDTRSDYDYNSTQLQKGIRIEMEHTKNRLIAKKIAKDHLDEYPDYYKELVKMESHLKHEMRETPRQEKKEHDMFGGVF
jgi:hypothetical protein